jgi:hypothetical protein
VEFTNLTGFPARMVTGSTGDTEMLYVIVCKVTYVLDQGWLIPVSEDQAWPVFDQPFVFEGTSLGPELDFRKQGVDLLVFGNAMARHGEPTQQMKVAIKCGRMRHEMEVFGDRRWGNSDSGLVPSEPEPFLEMPLRHDRAYGGKAVLDGIEMMHSANPEGRGLYLTEEEATGSPLPNLERPDDLIRHWTDQPRPACFFKLPGILDATGIPEKDPEAALLAKTESAFNDAAPELIAEASDLGDTLRLIGLSGDGDIVFPMPPQTGPTAYVSVGLLRSQFPSRVSSLVVLARDRTLIVTYRCLFRCLFRPLEKRCAELRWTADVKAGPVLS